MNYYRHDSAIVDEGAEIGEGSRVWHFVHVCAGARIGKRVSLGQNVFVGNRVTIGDDCKVQNNVSVYDNVTLEDGVFCGPSMVFTNVVNPEDRDLFVGAGLVAADKARLLPGSGVVLPQLHHGGPGRAGDGSELGGLRGLELYSQRVALQGDRPLLDALLG